ncbi:nuclear transport factor 2 family protein [Pseudomonas sp. v388]|uniref:nuclear transport factor 2 family protein n=1 Tax=Pseudomonas sp. v388 TaxID=2479849 RepID=UPI001C49A07F|nr:nuclear transport factor 2 family protein [Pseudomonas sp. v388]
MRSLRSWRARWFMLASPVLLSSVLLSSMASADSAASAEVRNKQIVNQAFDRWAAGGTTFFSDIVAPDVSWTIKGSGPSAGHFQGRDRFIEQAVRPFVSRLSSPVRPVSKQVWADGDHVVIHWDGKATARDGQPYHNSYAWIFRMQDGKAVEVTAFLDLTPYDDVLRRIPATASE